ncbi:SWIM zinc finger family protein [Chryseolinea sp. T2]|uniref:SWIM zinc finger family protein n=1 Tax=Chryseolinea sp. T2 TaxID=3129255 RepID=UPI003077B1E2
MQFSESQVQSLAPNPAAFTAGKKLSSKEQWQSFGRSDRAIWGAIKGSGSSPYLVQIDTISLAYKCTCPSRQFPCKHSIALMLLHAASEKNFATQEEEPEWVKGWMDKRGTPPKPKTEEKVRTEEEQEQLDKNREKTQTNRLLGVQEGAAELTMWLKDLVRMGLLELPSKNQQEFDRMAARMVDAKAPGLAGWVRALGRLNYDQGQAWQDEALGIISKLFLLLSALKNFDRLSPLWQQTIRNLAGWSQSTKELLADKEAETIKDHWLVVGQEVETTSEDITIQRNWLMGCTHNRQSMILNFGTRFTNIESNILPGTIIEGEMAFFPSVWPQRGALKIQRAVTNSLPAEPMAFETWKDVHEYKAEQLQVNPWLNDIVVVLKDALLIKSSTSWIVCDSSKHFQQLPSDFDIEKTLRWVAISGNRRLNMVLILRNNVVMPMGVFNNNHYHLL